MVDRYCLSRPESAGGGVELKSRFGRSTQSAFTRLSVKDEIGAHDEATHNGAQVTKHEAEKTKQNEYQEHDLMMKSQDPQERVEPKK